jgi:hypothetical protein
MDIFIELFETDLTDMKIANILKFYFNVSMTCVYDKRIKVFQVNCSVDEIKAGLSEQKIAHINVQYQQELEEDIGKQVNDLQEKYPSVNLFEKYRYQLMGKQEGIKDHFGVAEFIEGLMEEERTGIKKD